MAVVGSDVSCSHLSAPFKLQTTLTSSCMHIHTHKWTHMQSQTERHIAVQPQSEDMDISDKDEIGKCVSAPPCAMAGLRTALAVMCSAQ